MCISSTSATASHAPNGCGFDDLKLDGNTVDTGRYVIKATGEGSVEILDKQTGKWVRAWGDPHLHTSDGDKAQFQKDNLTIDLPDGTKVTIAVKELRSNGTSVIDKVAVMRGDEAVVLSGFNDGKSGIQSHRALSVAQVDAQFDDGVVVRPGAELDDLIAVGTGNEIIGTDPTQPFNEHLLDGLGGTSTYDFESVGDMAPIEFPPGASRLDKLAIILSRLYDKMDEKLDELGGYVDGTGRPPGQAPGQAKGELNEDAAINKVNLEIQKIQGLIQTVETTMSSLVKADKDVLSTIARNI